MFSSYFYIKTYFSLRQHKLQIQGQSSFNLAYYLKSLNSMFLVFCLFLTSYLPFVCALAAATVSGVNNLTMLILDITTWIALLNPSRNPLVYYWRVRDIKLEALHILKTKSAVLERPIDKIVIPVDCWQSVFLSKFQRGYEARRFSLKGNGTRHGRGSHEKKSSRLLPYSAIPLLSRLLSYSALAIPPFCVRDD